MTITKYEHACLVLKNENKLLIIDPGVLSASLPLEISYDYVVITHEHSDHIDPEKINAIFQKNPSVHFFVNQDVFDQSIKKYSAKHTIIDGGISANVEGFKFDFVGNDHAVIYLTSPCKNSGVVVNDIFYYPGDSFELPNVPIQVLAVPIAAPWMKTSEAIDFIKAIKPENVFPIHNGPLSEFGEIITYNWMSQTISGWQMLDVGESITLS